MITIPMSDLIAVRNQFNIRGADFARSMEMNDSTFSRFQQRESVEEHDARWYLTACGFDQIDEFIAFHGIPWELVEISPPSWLHPDREALQGLFTVCSALMSSREAANAMSCLRPQLDGSESDS
jgi:hypothetical protein